jgi:hypothetical protein
LQTSPRRTSVESGSPITYTPEVVSTEGSEG